MTSASIVLFLLALVPQRDAGWLPGKVTDKVENYPAARNIWYWSSKIHVHFGLASG